jgi:hypothetical protein
MDDRTPSDLHRPVRHGVRAGPIVERRPRKLRTGEPFHRQHGLAADRAPQATAAALRKAAADHRRVGVHLTVRDGAGNKRIYDRTARLSAEPPRGAKRVVQVDRTPCAGKAIVGFDRRLDLGVLLSGRTRHRRGHRSGAGDEHDAGKHERPDRGRDRQRDDREQTGGQGRRDR